MSENAKIKGSAINHTRVNYINQYGEDFWQEILEEACRRTGYEQKYRFLGSDFYPLDLYMEIEKIFAEKMSAQNKDYCLTFKAGMDNAEQAFATTYKIFMKFVSKKTLAKSAVRMHKRYYSEGELEINLDDKNRTITLNYKKPKVKHPYDYALCGYFAKALTIVGFRIKKAIHGNLVWEKGKTKLESRKLTPCSAEGDEDTIFIFKF